MYRKLGTYATGLRLGTGRRSRLFWLSSWCIGRGNAGTGHHPGHHFRKGEATGRKHRCDRFEGCVPERLFTCGGEVMYSRHEVCFDQAIEIAHRVFWGKRLRDVLSGTPPCRIGRRMQVWDGSGGGIGTDSQDVVEPSTPMLG